MTSRRKQSGLALISVLLGTTALAIVASAVMESTRSSLIVAATAQARAKADAQAQAGIYASIGTLLETGRRTTGKETDPLAFDGTTVQVAITPESGKVDLNAATEEVLFDLFMAATDEEEYARQLTDHLADWRDADHFTHLNGAEMPAYRAENALDPRNAPFGTIDEIRQILGFPQDLFPCIEGYITTYSGQPVPDFRSWRRDEKADETDGPAPKARSIIDAGPSLSGKAFTIEARVDTAGSGSVIRRAVVRITGDRRQPYRIMHWTRIFDYGPSGELAVDGCRRLIQ